MSTYLYEARKLKYTSEGLTKELWTCKLKETDVTLMFTSISVTLTFTQLQHANHVKLISATMGVKLIWYQKVSFKHLGNTYEKDF